MKKIIFLGIDVDDKAFHATAILGEGKKEQVMQFKTKPSVSALKSKLQKYIDEGSKVKACYEATYIGFNLARDLKDLGIDCEVIAPSSVPRAPGQTAKTDRIDSGKLAKYYKNGLLTVVNVPDEKAEHVRNIVRSRMFLAQQLKDLKRHILSTCRRGRLDYRKSVEFKNPAFFTNLHMQWLETELNKSEFEELQFNIKMLLSEMRQLELQISKYDDEILRYSEMPEYKKKVEALACYRGLDVLGSMSLITELGDIRRFDHPTKLASYAGMDLREYSSGGRERKYGISKMGNRRIRTTAIEACQRAYKIPIISKRLKARREKTEPKFIEIADRCMKRLHKKSTRMIFAGKPINKVKVAVARELLCFVWESLRVAA